MVSFSVCGRVEVGFWYCCCFLKSCQFYCSCLLPAFLSAFFDVKKKFIWRKFVNLNYLVALQSTKVCGREICTIPVTLSIGYERPHDSPRKNRADKQRDVHNIRANHSYAHIRSRKIKEEPVMRERERDGLMLNTYNKNLIIVVKGSIAAYGMYSFDHRIMYTWMYFKSQHSVWYVLMCINLNLISSRRKKCMVMIFVLFRMNFPNYVTWSIKTNWIPPLKKFVKKPIPVRAVYLNFLDFGWIFQNFQVCSSLNLMVVTWLLTFEGCI